ncbi:MAG: tyrosine-type recombinase/integrase [Desulfobacterales bacterium]|nr:tyrosine-type recombinase/integrase [Desulfobacterales bacterium]
MNVHKTIAEFKKHLKATGYADKTIELYAWGLDAFESWLNKKKIKDLKQINFKTIISYQEKLMKEPLAKESKAIKIRAVKRLFEHLSNSHKLLINPTEGIIETSRINRKIGIVLTVTEMQHLLKQPNISLVTGIRDRAVMELLYSTGIRADELEALTVHHVDLIENVLYVRKGKGNRQRVVPLGKTASSFVTEYLEAVRPRDLKKNPESKSLFLTVKGETLTANAVRTFLKKYRQTAGIEKRITPHTFRRTCATHMLQQGADIRDISSLLGHVKISTTQTYTKVLPVEVKKTHDKTHPDPTEAKK